MEKDIKLYFADIYSNLEENKVIFFLGSGFSLNFNVVSWSNFLEKLIEEIINDIDTKSSQSIFKSDNKLIKKELNIIKEKIYKNIIDIDYALEMIYLILEIDISEDMIINNILSARINFIKNIYKEAFKFDSNKIRNQKIDEKLLLDFSKVLKKVITTNYDNILLYKYSMTEIKTKFNSFYLPYEYDNLNFESDFYWPIHGSILNDSFNDIGEEISPWKIYEHTSSKFFQFPIIDSFSSFQSQYGIEKKENYKILEKVINYAYRNNWRIIFFGYSFNDYFVSKEIMKIILDIKEEGKVFEKFIYIIKDNIDIKIKSELEETTNVNFYNPLIENKFIKYINFSDIIDYHKNNKNNSWLVKKYDKELKKLKGVISEYKKNDFLSNKKNLDIFYKLMERDENFKLIKNEEYKNILPNIQGIYKNLNTKNLNYILKLNEIDIQLKPIFHLTWIYKEFDYSPECIFKKYYHPKQSNLYISNNIGIFCYSIIYCFKLELKDNELIFKIFFLNYVPFQEKDKIIKLPNLTVEIENLKGMGTFLKNESISLKKEWWHEFNN